MSETTSHASPSVELRSVPSTEFLLVGNRRCGRPLGHICSRGSFKRLMMEYGLRNSSFKPRQRFAILRCSFGEGFSAEMHNTTLGYRDDNRTQGMGRDVSRAAVYNIFDTNSVDDWGINLYLHKLHAGIDSEETPNAACSTSSKSVSGGFAAAFFSSVDWIQANISLV